MKGLYILAGQTPVPEEDVLTWAEWFGIDANRIVAQTDIPGGSVSTVFIGVDLSHRNPPLLFETAVFRGPGRGPSLETYRCATWLEAEALHAQILADVLEGRQS